MASCLRHAHGAAAMAALFRLLRLALAQQVCWTDAKESGLGLHWAAIFRLLLRSALMEQVHACFVMWQSSAELQQRHLLLACLQHS